MDLIEFIQDDSRLREERKKAKKNKDKYIGMSQDSFGMMRKGGFTSGGCGGGVDYDWDGGNSTGGKNSFQDSPNNSDDEDSATEAKEYKDDVSKKYSSVNDKTSSPSPPASLGTVSMAATATAAKKSAKPSRMVSLGAAASYTNDAAPPTPPAAHPPTTTSHQL